MKNKKWTREKLASLSCVDGIFKLRCRKKQKQKILHQILLLEYLLQFQ